MDKVQKPNNPAYYTPPSPITEAARSKEWNVFARSNTEIIGSNLTHGMDVCVYSVFVFPCVVSGLALGWSPVQGVLMTVYKIKEKEVNRNV
jgi:hypothetical protein